MLNTSKPKKYKSNNHYDNNNLLVNKQKQLPELKINKKLHNFDLNKKYKKFSDLDLLDIKRNKSKLEKFSKSKKPPMPTFYK